MYSQLRYWITPEGDLIEVPEDHQRLLKKLTGMSKEDALKRGWIRVIRDPRFSNYWYFEVQNARDEGTLERIEDFIMSPENEQTGDAVAASISTTEPKQMYFPVEWQDLEGSFFREAAEASFLREIRRREGYRSHELRGGPRRKNMETPMRRFKYVVIHMKGIDPVGVFPASTKKEARETRDKIQDTQNFGFHEVEQVWIWNIETNEQED